MLLEDHDAVGAGPCDWNAVDEDLSRSLRVQACNQMQQRGLAASRGTDDAEKFSRFDLQVNLVERQQAFAALRAIAERNIVQPDFRDHRRNWPYNVAHGYRAHLLSGLLLSPVCLPDSRTRGNHRVDWNRKLRRKILCECSLDRLPFLFSKNFVEQLEVVETGEIGHLPAQGTVVERLLRSCVQSRVQRIVGNLQTRERFVENHRSERFAGLLLNLLVQQFLRFGLVSVDPVGEFDVGANPVLHQIGMRALKLCVDHEYADDELAVGPECPFVKEEAAVALMDQAGGPRLRSPRGIEVLFQEQGQLVRIGHGDNLDVAALVVRLQAVFLKPVAERDILRVAELRRGNALAVKVFRLVDAGIVADDQGSSAAGRSGDDAQRFAVGANIAVDRGVRADIGHVDRAREKRFNRRRAGVETGPLHFHLRSHGFVEKAVGLSNHSLGMCDVGKSADPNRRLLPMLKL